MEGKGLPLVHSGERTNTEGKPVSSLILLSLPDSDTEELPFPISGLPSFLNCTKHLDEHRLFCEHFGELFDQGL